MYHMIVEQTCDYEYRMTYDPIQNKFEETSYKSLAYARHFQHPYGWIKESGTPPGRHLDVILLSSKKYNLGDEVAIKIVGCFVRNDGDNKLISIVSDRIENDLNELAQNELDDLKVLYPKVDEGEGWFGVKKAEEIIAFYFSN